MFKDFVPTIIDSKTSTEVMIKLEGDVLIIRFEGATSKLDFRQALDIRYFYHRGCKCWFHKRTYDKLLSVYSQILEYVANLEKQYKSIKIEGFSQGGALAEQAFMMLKKGLNLRYVTCRILEPYIGVLNFPERVTVCEKSIIWRWPLFIFAPKKIDRIKSPYRWWQFIKNHFYLREIYV